MPDILTIDRFEGGCAVCEDTERQMHRLPRALLPAEAAEGDRLRREGAGWVIDREGAEQRKAALRRRMDALWE